MNLIDIAIAYAANAAVVTASATLLAFGAEDMVRMAKTPFLAKWLKWGSAAVLTGASVIGWFAAVKWVMNGAVLAIAGLLVAMGGAV